jgi:septal ring factor EnvC (AmiA/AmiB activator)
MTKKINGLGLAVLGILFMAGCATTSRNYQSDIDSLNSRITSLQAQLSEKDQQISKLQGELGGQKDILNRAESEKRDLSDKLNSAQAKLDAAEKKSKTPAKPEESDLK